MEEFYNRNYKKLLFIPILLLVLSLIIIGNNYRKTGDIINKDVSLKGGLSIEFYSDNIKKESFKNLEEELKKKFEGKDLFIRKFF